MSTENEEQYFLENLAEQRKRVRLELEQNAKEEAQKSGLANALDVQNEDLISRIRALGFDGDTGRLFDLLPLIYVAWADGRIQAAERNSILQILEAKNIEKGSEAWIFAEALLEQKPSQEYMDLTLSLLKDVHALSGESVQSILELATVVAEASGGFLGLTNPISADERDALTKIAGKLQVDDQTLKTLLGE